MKDEKKKWKSLSMNKTELPNVNEFASEPLAAGLWCLYVSKMDFNIDYRSFDDLETILREILDVPISVIQIKKAFARAGTKVIRSRDGTAYKISGPGEIYLRGLKKDEPLKVLYVSAAEPRTANKNLETLVKSIRKDSLRVCDPFYGLKTLDVLEVLAKHHKRVSFLTAKIGGGEKVATLNRAVSEFKKEYGKKVEIRLLSSNDLHDRYIIAKDQFLLIGQGIKDLGRKESLIVVVEDRHGKEIRKTLTAAFDKRWANAKSLP